METEKPKPNLEPLLVNVNELAVLLNLSRAAVYAALSAGKIGPRPIRVFGRRTLFSRAEIESWVRSGCINRDQWLKFKEHSA